MQKGEVFVALCDVRDGHDYAESAVKNGAVALLVSRKIENVNVPQLVVDDTLKALESIALAAREQSAAKRVAITGSCGKTTTKELLALALNAHKPEKSFNNHIGVPLTLARMPKESNFAVFELGMNNPGEIAPLSKLVSPEVAVVTTVAPAHMAAFDSLDAIAAEKLSICEGLSQKGALVLPRTLFETYRDMLPENVVTFDPSDRRADVFANNVVPQPEGVLIQAHVQGELVDVSVALVGDHMVANVLTVLAVCKQLGFPLERAAKNLSQAKPMPGRGQITVAEGITILDESYNANPASMAAALTMFAALPTTGKKYAFLGQMNEMGGDSRTFHENLAPYCTALDGVFTVGEDIEPLAHILENSAQHFSTVSEIDLNVVKAQLREGDVVLIKGSNTIFWATNFVTNLIYKLKEQGAA